MGLGGPTLILASNVGAESGINLPHAKVYESVINLRKEGQSARAREGMDGSCKYLTSAGHARTTDQDADI